MKTYPINLLKLRTIKIHESCTRRETQRQIEQKTIKNLFFCSFIFMFLLTGCVTKLAKRMDSDSRFASAAESLTRDFLEGQKQGESGRQAAEKYGHGAGKCFLNLVDYRFEGVGHSLGFASAFFRGKASNRMGAVMWTDFQVHLIHYPKLEAEGDKYLGLRIANVSETLQSKWANER